MSREIVLAHFVAKLFFFYESPVWSFANSLFSFLLATFFAAELLVTVLISILTDLRKSLIIAEELAPIFFS